MALTLTDSLRPETWVILPVSLTTTTTTWSIPKPCLLSWHLLYLVIPFHCRSSSELAHCHHLWTGVSGSSVLPAPPNCFSSVSTEVFRKWKFNYLIRLLKILPLFLFALEVKPKWLSITYEVLQNLPPPPPIISHFSPSLSMLHGMPALPKDLEPLGFTLCSPDCPPPSLFLSWNTFFLLVSWRTPLYLSCECFLTLGKLSESSGETRGPSSEHLTLSSSTWTVALRDRWRGYWFVCWYP